MTATITPAAPPLASSRTRMAALALLIPAGPLAIAILRAILPYYTTDSATAVAREVATHQGAEAAITWLVLIAWLTLVPGTIVIGAMAARSRPGLGTAALVLSVAGFAMVPAIAATDLATFTAARAGMSTAQIAG